MTYFSPSQSTPFSSATALVSDTSKTSNISFPAFVPNTLTPIAESHKFLLQELDISLMDEIEGYLWMAGLTVDKIRPFHRQLVVGRKIVVCEQVHLHLVWNRDSIFVKPIPKCLLHHGFFEQYITPHPYFHTISMGFLSTYLKLIKYESDFIIARERSLVPSETTWDAWLKFSEQLQTALTDPRTQRKFFFHGRYGRGELRLSRLNLIMQIFRGRLTRGFVTLDTNYSTYFSRFLSAVILAFAYVGTALAAFQVAMARPSASQKLISLGYWFSVTILLVLVCLVIVPVAWFILLSLDSFVFALKRKVPAP